MKIIDILNKMANGELEDGFKFNFGDTYTYNKNTDSIKDKEGIAIGNIYCIENILDCKVEVIEEKKEIEELHEYKNIGYSECDIKTNREKLNEVIRAVNKINKDLEKGQTLNIEIDEETISNAIKKARNYLEREEEQNGRNKKH